MLFLGLGLGDFWWLFVHRLNLSTVRKKGVGIAEQDVVVILCPLASGPPASAVG